MRLPPRATRTDTPFPCTALFRSQGAVGRGVNGGQRRRPDATVINLHSYCHIAGIDADDTGAMPNPMRVAIVSETYPPEVNGVALTVQALEQDRKRSCRESVCQYV